MSVTTEILPLTETASPADQAELAAMVAAAYARSEAIYPIGGGTSLDYGLVPKRPGRGLSLANLTGVVDYPARDMTITVEAGIPIARLAETLAAERQWLPIDIPQPEQATLGGLVATAWSGPRRYGWGTVRDYVIGVHAVDGRGTPFKGGGRVVKNVAGYDFCKLLTGSLGTLGVITQLTLKIRPMPERSVLLACQFENLAQAETILAAMVRSQTTPSAIELLTGPAWNDGAALPSLVSGMAGHIVAGLEGTAAEVGWMAEQLAGEWQQQGVRQIDAVTDNAGGLWQRLSEFPAQGEAPLVVKATLRPGKVVEFVAEVQQIDPAASIQAHAGNGIVLVRFSQFASSEVSRTLVGRIQPAAAAAGGHAIVLSCEYAVELTRQAVWGGVEPATAWMQRVKRQFDPKGILNPGRFIYGES